MKVKQEEMKNMEIIKIASERKCHILKTKIQHTHNWCLKILQNLELKHFFPKKKENIP